MPKGGARINSGPPPDPNALRRDRNAGLDRDGWTTLPSGGFQGDIPPWPLLPDIGLRARLQVAQSQAERLEARLDEAPPAERDALERRLARTEETVSVLTFQVAEQEEREHGLWAEAWRSPQAAAWAARVGWARDVAQYVRHKVLGELGSLEDAKEARQWSDRLGLNPAAMLRNRWRVAPDQVAEQRTTRRAPAPARSSARARLQAVTDGGA